MKNTTRLFFVITSSFIFHSSSPISMSEILLKPKNYLELCTCMITSNMRSWSWNVTGSNQTIGNFIEKNVFGRVACRGLGNSACVVL